MNVNFKSVVKEVKNKDVSPGEYLVVKYKNTLLQLLNYIGEERFEEFCLIMKSMDGWHEARDLFTGKFFDYHLLRNLLHSKNKYKEEFKVWVEFGIDDDVMWSIIKLHRQRLNMYLRLYEFGVYDVHEDEMFKDGEYVGTFASNVLELYVYYLCSVLMREVINK